MIQKLLLAILALMCMTSCNPSQPTTENTKPLIVCTTGMIADCVQQLVGDAADVVALMGPGVDPHLYKATQGDLSRLRQANAIVYNGLHLEGKMQSILEKLSKEKPVYAVTSGLRKEKLLEDAENPGNFDPHIWFDLQLWGEAFQGVSTFLMATFPTRANEIEANHGFFQKSMEALDHTNKSVLAQIPEEKRILVTAHDAFRYFGRAYNVRVESLQGISTASEYGLRDITRIVNLITEKKIPVVFIESSISPRSLQAVVEGCQKNGHQVQIGGSLYSDALGEKNAAAATFKGTVLHNLNTIASGLLQTTPPNG